MSRPSAHKTVFVPLSVFSSPPLSSCPLPLPSIRHHRNNGDCPEGKTENKQVCSVQHCVQQLCTVQCTHNIRTDLTVAIRITDPYRNTGKTCLGGGMYCLSASSYHYHYRDY